MVEAVMSEIENGSTEALPEALAEGPPARRPSGRPTVLVPTEPVKWLRELVRPRMIDIRAAGVEWWCCGGV